MIVPPYDFLSCQSVNYVIDSQETGVGNRLLQIDQDGNISHQWSINSTTSHASLNMDTESNLIDTNCVQGVIISDQKLYLFKNQAIEQVNTDNQPILNCYGIFDGHALVGTKDGDLLVDINDSKHETKKVTFDTNRAEKFTCFIPCDDFNTRRYSICGLFYNKFFYLFEREKKVFEKFTINDTSMFRSLIASGRFRKDCVYVPWKEGNAIRSLVSCGGRLLEILFDLKELTVVDHLPWESNISFIGLTEKYGILIFFFDKCLSYKPATKGSPMENGKIQLILEQRITISVDSIIGCSEKSNAILEFKKLGCSATVIDESKAKHIPYWTREEIDKKFSFKTYQLGREHPNIRVVTKDEILKDSFILPSFRGECIHSIYQSAKLSNFHITRGINCKTKYPKLCSENYEEMTSVKEFSNYLGAPLYIGSDDDKYSFVFHVEDTYLQYGTLREISCGRASIKCNEDNAFGILEPKDSEENEDSDDEEAKVNLDEEWVSMMENDEILVESGKLKVIDFTTDRPDESSVIDNVKNGVWAATQLNPSYPKQILLFNKEYAKDHPEIEKDWETPGNIFDSDFDLFNQEIRHGWHVSEIIGLDHGVGIIDHDKFEDSSLFKSTKQKSMDWYDVVNGIVNESSDKQLITFPFGVFSTCCNGDGAYPCLYKMHEDKVVAVRVAFANYKAPRIK